MKIISTIILKGNSRCKIFIPKEENVFLFYRNVHREWKNHGAFAKGIEVLDNSIPLISKHWQGFSEKESPFSRNIKVNGVNRQVMGDNGKEMEGFVPSNDANGQAFGDNGQSTDAHGKRFAAHVNVFAAHGKVFACFFGDFEAFGGDSVGYEIMINYC